MHASGIVCKHVYVCMCACVHACVCVYMYMHALGCVQVYVCAHTQSCMHVCTSMLASVLFPFFILHTISTGFFPQRCFYLSHYIIFTRKNTFQTPDATVQWEMFVMQFKKVQY